MINPRILVAMDAFKGSLHAEQACNTVRRGLLRAIPQALVKVQPLADGGEGSLDLLLKHIPGGQRIQRKVMGPLEELTVNAAFGWWPDQQLAVVEAAQACGLPHIPQASRNPMAATTYGVGQLLLAASETGAKRIILAVGGSASMDAGLGAARALGWQATDALGQTVRHGATGLKNLVSFTSPTITLPCAIEVWCDVHIPLLGSRGTACMFGPQKGATPQQVLEVEDTLNRLVMHPRFVQKLAIKDLPGSGAAGGLAWGMAIFAGATLDPGAKQFAKQVGLDLQVAAADFVITGEGCFDSTSLEGKVVSLVARITQEQGKKLCLLAGQINAPLDLIGAVHGKAARPPGVTRAQALGNAGVYLEEAAYALGSVLTAAAE